MYLLLDNSNQFLQGVSVDVARLGRGVGEGEVGQPLVEQVHPNPLTFLHNFLRKVRKVRDIKKKLGLIGKPLVTL